MDERTLPTISGDLPVEGENALRVVVIGSIYAAAVFFAVAFSPAMGFFNLPSSAPLDRLASADMSAGTAR